MVKKFYNLGVTGLVKFVNLLKFSTAGTLVIFLKNPKTFSHKKFFSTIHIRLKLFYWISGTTLLYYLFFLKIKLNFGMVDKKQNKIEKIFFFLLTQFLRFIMNIQLLYNVNNGFKIFILPNFLGQQKFWFSTFELVKKFFPGFFFEENFPFSTKKSSAFSAF